MPVLVENIKCYFETLQIHANESNFHTINNKDEIKDIEINGLYTDVSVNNALRFINDEFSTIISLSKDSLKRSVKQHLRSVELMIVIYQLHGQFLPELNSIKFYRNLCKLSCDLDERNYAYSLEAFWHLIHDTKSCIPEKSVELCRNIIINNHTINERSNKRFVVSMAKIVFKTSQPDPKLLIDQISELKSIYQNYFDKCTLDSFQARNSLAYYEHVLKMKMFSVNLWNDRFDFVDNALIIRKISLKSIDYLRSKYTDLKLHSGSYDSLLYLWKCINNLLAGLEILAEFYTLMGIEIETKKFQYEFFSSSVKYCVPFRTKMAVRLMMHNEFIYLRLPELSIRDAQLNQIRKDLEILDSSSYQQTSELVEHNIAEYHYGIMESKNDYFKVPFDVKRKKKKVRSNMLCFMTCLDEEKEVGFEECFLSKSTFRVELMDLFSVIKSYIWKIEDPKLRKFSVCSDWQYNFIDYADEQENLMLNFNSITLSTPPTSPTKSLGPDTRKNLDNLNAPIRLRRYEPLVNIPMIVQNQSNQIQSKDNLDTDDDLVSCNPPIESFSTVFLPNKVRNIRYEEPELPRSMIVESKSVQIMNFQKDLALFELLAHQEIPMRIKNTVKIEGPSLIQYLEQHIEKFKHLNIPVIHRPVYQRLGLHYLSINQKKAAYYFSLAISIGFRQMYTLECSVKLKLSERWNKTNDIVNSIMKSDTEMHSTLEVLLPTNWTILQFTMIDEIAIPGIKSSLLDNSDGGCFGARNCAVLLVTKYQKTTLVNGKSKLTIETRVLHGFRKTGLQLMDQLESLKAESVKALKITERREWWAKRFSIDSKLKALTNQMRNDWFSDKNLAWMMDESTVLESEPKILIADRNICRLPLECLLIKDFRKANCITRMPNMLCLIGHLYQSRFRNSNDEKRERSVTKTNLEIDPFNAFFLVNPDNTLQETQDTVLPLFQSKLKWDGMTGSTIHNLDPINVLNSKDMIIYCGHGAGYRYFMHRSIKSVTSAASIFLMGCQSARFIVEGRSEAFGMIMYYLTIGCPSIMGLLWDVTDREIDKFTMKMLLSWLKRENKNLILSQTYYPVPPMPTYLFNQDVINNVQLKSLTGNSAVIFGLPTWIDVSTELPDL